MENKLFRKLLSVTLALTVVSGTACFAAMTAGAQTVEKASVSAVQQKLTNTSVISADTIALGSTVTVSASAAGGQGGYTYSVLYKKHKLAKWTVKQDYSTNTKVKIKPGAVTDYDVCVKAKDSRGIIAKSYFTVKVRPKLENKSQISSDFTAVGCPVAVYAIESGGLGGYQYAAFCKHKSSAKWTTVRNYSDDSYFEVAPSKNEDLEICVKIKDRSGTIAKKYFTVGIVDYVKEVHKLVNEERAKEDLAPMALNSKLCKAAAERAAELADTFSHYRPDGTLCFTILDEYNISYWGAGENIACYYTTPESVMTGWMNSEGHRENIMSNSFTDIGIGFYVKDGTRYWVQLFIIAD